MSEPLAFSGVPDETWDPKAVAAYEALKAKWLAEKPPEPDWLDDPMVPADDLDNLLDELMAGYLARGDGK